MKDCQLELFALTPEVCRTRHRTQPQSCDGSIVSRRDRLNVRDRVLVARYYYWTELERRRFDDVLHILSEREFFVEERTISRVLLSQDAFFTELCRDKVSRKQLHKMFPGFDWTPTTL